jgi:glycosyltransferase involved in cell wall biosynthesis
MSVIPIGVDTDFFKPTVGKSPLSDGRFKILTVARLHPYKGLNYLIEAMAMVKKDRPDIVLYIKGSGPQGSDLKALAHGKGLDETVRFVDMPLPYETMPAVYSSADAYVQPSVIEPFGCAVTEAMACGKPTICSRVGGMMDTVDDGETGYLVKPADPEELAGRIIELASDAGRARAMGERARSRAVEKFSWPVVSNQYSDLIRDITEKR